MNKVILMGRLTRDPDIRYTQTGEPMCVARYTLAVDRRRRRDAQDDGKPTADFVSCVAFGKSGEFAEKYLHKGIKICISGRIQTGSYVKSDGTKVYTTDVVVDDHEFAERKADSETGGDYQNGGYQNGSYQSQQDLDGFMTVPDGYDNEMPWN